MYGIRKSVNGKRWEYTMFTFSSLKEAQHAAEMFNDDPKDTHLYDVKEIK